MVESQLMVGDFNFKRKSFRHPTEGAGTLAHIPPSSSSSLIIFLIIERRKKGQRCIFFLFFRGRSFPNKRLTFSPSPETPTCSFSFHFMSYQDRARRNQTLKKHETKLKSSRKQFSHNYFSRARLLPRSVLAVLK